VEISTLPPRVPIPDLQRQVRQIGRLWASESVGYAGCGARIFFRDHRPAREDHAGGRAARAAALAVAVHLLRQAGAYQITRNCTRGVGYQIPNIPPNRLPVAPTRCAYPLYLTIIGH
jgi:hypothetical protein